MGRVAHSRLDELRKCAQPMSWMDDDEVIDVLNELWSARETINDVSAKLIQDERQLAAQTAEIERLTKEAVANEASIACAEGIRQQMEEELAERDARERMVREAASNLAARVEECVLSSNYCYAAHNFRCSYDKAFYRNIENPFISRDERHKAAEAAGCNCGMQDEHDQVEKATQELRAALSANSDEQTPTPTEPSQAQQAEPPAGCAEMAFKLADAAHRNSNMDAEWFTHVQDEMASNIAPLFTLLAECRDDFEAIRDTLGETPVRIRNTAWRARKRIDAALGKGDADGGREEESSE